MDPGYDEAYGGGGPGNSPRYGGTGPSGAGGGVGGGGTAAGAAAAPATSWTTKSRSERRIASPKGTRLMTDRNRSRGRGGTLRRAPGPRLLPGLQLTK